MTVPWHALTLRSKGQRSNPNPRPRWFMVLTFSMGMRSSVSGYQCTFFNLLSILIMWQQVQSKLIFAWRGSACPYECIFL